MFLTRKHLSRRTVLKGAGATFALPLLDAMVPAGTALAQTAAAAAPRLGFVYFPHGALQDQWQPTRVGRNPDFPVHPRAAGAGPRVRDRGQRPAQQGRGEQQPARHHRGDLAELRGPAPAQRQDRRRRHGRSDRRAAPGQGDAAAVAGAVRRAGRHDLVPHAGPAAADGKQSAEGVLRHVRAGRHAGRAQGHPEHDEQPARLRARRDGQPEPQAGRGRPRARERLPGFGPRDRAARAEAGEERQLDGAAGRAARVRRRISASCSACSSR